MLRKNRRIILLLNFTSIIIWMASDSLAQVQRPVSSITPPSPSQSTSNSKAGPSFSPAPLPKTTTPVPTPVTPPSFSHFFNFEKTAGNWLGLLGVLIAASLGFFQWLGSQKLQRELKQKDLDHTKELKEKDLENSAKIEELKYKYTLAVKKWELRQTRFQNSLKEKERREQEAKAEAERLGRIQSQAENYFKGLAQELENLKILGMPKPLKLKDVYVQLKIQEDSFGYAKLEEITEPSKIRPEEIFQRNQMRLIEQTATAVSPEDALGSFQRIVLLGDPGAGKTTTLKYLALEMLQGSDKLPYLPIFIELKGFIESKADTLIDFITSDWVKKYGFLNIDARFYLETQLNNGKAVLLLDGLDEVQGGSTVEEADNAYHKITTEINNLCKTPCPIVVTCRRQGWKDGLPAFHNLEVLDFNEEQIKKFLESWFRSEPDKARDLWIKLEGKLRMRMLGTNPLILSLIAIVYEQDLNLPEGRAELYSRCVDLFLRKWDLDRNVKRFSQFKTHHKHALLKEIAWHFHCKGKRYFPKKEIQEIISNFLHRFTIPVEESAEILDEITTQFGLLKEQAYNLYGFIHLTFQEYFTALAAIEKIPHSLPEVIAYKHSAWWEEVILLMSAEMIDATSLLLGILHDQFDEPISYQDEYQPIQREELLCFNDDLFHNNLLLAARCLASNPKINMIDLRDRIILNIENLLLTSPYEFDWERAAKALAEISWDTTQILLAMLADENIQPLKRRAVIAEALGKFSSERVAESLLTALHRLEPNQENITLRTSILEALVSLRANSTIPDLRRILEVEQNPLFKFRLIKAIGILSNKAEASLSLLQMFLDKEIPAEIKLEIFESLRELKEPSTANQTLNHLEDESIDWQLRWLLVESLEGLQEHVEAELRQLLINSAIDERVRVGIATVLGMWGVQEVVPILDRAIEQRLVPPNLSIEHYVWTGHIWVAMSRVSKKLGSTFVQTLLLQALNNPGAEEFELAGIALAVAEYDSEAAAYKVLSVLRERSFIFSPILIGFLPRLANKSIESDLLGLLNLPEDVQVDSRFSNSLDIVFVATAIGRVSNTVKAVNVLLKLIRFASNNFTLTDIVESMVINALYKALYQVSQQAKVRLTQDYQIQTL